ncbi:MAG: 50S ribosomal protein L32e [Candidatus Methylarchaceae archaeon HK02M1]|nr:50S ribosomal protein L32e [Candidatus Methylarchaceae archaeon HK02M1]
MKSRRVDDMAEETTSKAKITKKKKVKTTSRTKVKEKKGVKTKASRARKKKKKNMKELLKLRNSIDDKRPMFMRQESWRYKRIDRSWRKPKGIDSRMRRRLKGWPKAVKVGYRGPKITRGIHPSGYRDVLVHNIGELEGLNPKKDAARLASTLGAKKRAELIEKAKELGIKVLNPRGLRKTKVIETPE